MKLDFMIGLNPNGSIRWMMAKFKRMTCYSHGGPVYAADHIVPPALGGADTPANMQWQTIQAAKAKDRGATYG